jgi:hypothetical protein
MSIPRDWNIAENSTVVHQLTASTFFPGKVFPYPIELLPGNIPQTMPGLTAAYVTGYENPETIQTGVTATGEMVAIRHDGNTGKGYVWVIGITGIGEIIYSPLIKPVESHHWELSAAIPVEDLFDRRNR